MPDIRPGLDLRRLMRLEHEAIHRCGLDLSGLTVLTEAATGPYVVTPVIAALAGAEVYALAAGTPHGSSEEIRNLTVELARTGGVRSRLHLISAKDSRAIGAADIVTNSGQVRPIDREMVAHMRPSAVVALMYERWEYRATDVDLQACRTRGIAVGGTNERHPAVDVFSFLGQMALVQLHDAGVAVPGSEILLLCDNDFSPYIEHDLKVAGAGVRSVSRFSCDVLSSKCDAVIVALQPHDAPVFTADHTKLLSRVAPGAVLIQYWGDVDRVALAQERVPVWPANAPPAGHMGVLPSALGPEPIVRLQAGGLKVGEVLARGLDRASPVELSLVQLL